MKRVVWLVMLVALITGCDALGQPSAEEIVRRAQNAMENVEEAHAVVEVDVTAEGESHQVVTEGWMRDKNVRGLILDASQPELIGAEAVSDGTTGWFYHPESDVVLTGSIEELKAYREEQGDTPSEFDFNNLTETVDELLRMTDEALVGSETIAGFDAWHLRLTPNTEAPPQLSAAGGVVDLWISETTDLPLQLTYAGGAMGEGRVTVREYDGTPELPADLFSFTPPAGTTVTDVATLLPEQMNLAEARQTAPFHLLSTSDDTAESALVSVYRVQDAFVQEFDGTVGVWTLTQQATAPEHHAEHMQSAETVEVRGAGGWLLTDAERGKTMLGWEENGAFVLIHGALSPDAALAIAEGLE